MKTLFVATAMFVALSSFSFMGAHSFVLLVDDKQVAEQYIDSRSSVPKIEVGNHHKLVVKYSECGRTVSGRKITAKDNNDKVVKEWKFDGTAAGLNNPMELSVKDLVSLQQRSNGELKLFYSSNDFPAGQHFVTVTP